VDCHPTSISHHKVLLGDFVMVSAPIPFPLHLLRCHHHSMLLHQALKHLWGVLALLLDLNLWQWLLFFKLIWLWDLGPGLIKTTFNYNKISLPFSHTFIFSNGVIG
jgi:hypothetical protein